MIVDGHVQCVSKLRTFSKSAFSQVCDKELVNHPMDPYDGEASMEIRQLQERDQDLVKVHNWFSKNKRPPFHKARNHGYVILYRVSKEDGALCVVIPLCEKRNIIQQSHADKTSAYLGVRETLARMKQKFYWPGIRKDVRSYVASCEPCSKCKCLLQKNRDLIKRQALGCHEQKVFEKREQGRQPPEHSNTHKVMNGTTEGMPDLESGVTKVVNQQDEKLVHDSAWLESEVSRRPKRKKKSFAWLSAYDQHC